jgi:hypothetical protein
MQGLQVELIRGLCRHELHRWPLHCLGDRFSIPEVVLLPFRIGTKRTSRASTGHRGQEHGRTIPLADVGQHLILQ